MHIKWYLSIITYANAYKCRCGVTLVATTGREPVAE